ncbi:MAG: hypothetical protein VR72_15785 [Clostridiaceae bacterium BRH_c20a]|nr:MAG: hypothetical protein VR72_15785 [Clostridiaceae bacterium BRH_c20a]
MIEKNCWQSYMPTRVIYANGAVNVLGGEVLKIGKSVLLVTGRTSMRKLGITERVCTILEKAGVKVNVYEKIESNPRLETVEEGGFYARDLNVDVIIGLGGGSAMDSAKGISAVATTGKKIEEVMQEPNLPILKPIVAIPTTSGTGSEVTHISVFTDVKKMRKSALRSTNTFPQIALVDPELTYPLSPYFTAVTGMDALTHAIEAILIHDFNPVVDAWAEKAILLASKYLVSATTIGDAESRAGMAQASVLAGMAISQVGTGLAHGIGMSLGGVFDIDHGAAVGFLLPKVLEFNSPIREQKSRLIANLISEGANFSSGYSADEAVKQLFNTLPIQRGLNSLGIKEDQLEMVVGDALTQGATKNNPRMVSREDIWSVLKCSL